MAVAVGIVLLGIAILTTYALRTSGTDPAVAPPTSSTAPPTTVPTTEPTPEPRVAAAVTVYPEASQTAMDVLADGGTAADAAVAVAAVLSVMEPRYSNVISGELAALYHDGSSGDIESLEAVGAVGSDFDLAEYRARGAAGFGLYQSLVPGAWGGWMLMLREYGELDLDRLLAPAIALARDGHPITAATARQAVTSLQQGAMNQPAQQVFAPNGRVPGAGETVVQADFASSLQSIADAYGAAPDRLSGLQAARDYVYEGELGQRILAAARADGASFTATDMASYRAQFKEPITLEYRDDATVHQNPPTSQGITMLMALNILNQTELPADSAGSADAAQLQIEAMKLAMADREAYVGDPNFTDVPIEELLSAEYGQQQFARIDLNSSAQWPIQGGLDGDTTTFQIVDDAGNAITVTTSTGYQFTAAGDTGIMMSNRMRYMTADNPQSPNFLEPGKQVRYTGNPYMVTDSNGLRLIGGAIGGDTQSQIQTQAVVNVLDFGLSPAEAISRHRFVTQTVPNSVVPHGVPNRVRIESSTPGDIVSSLRQRGQNVELTAGVGPFGYGSMIELIDDGQNAEIGTETRTDTSTGLVRLPGE